MAEVAEAPRCAYASLHHILHSLRSRQQTATTVGRKFVSKGEAIADDVENSDRLALSILAFLPA